METKCKRCGKKLPEKYYLIQVVVYLGKHYPRLPICKECYESFVDWFDEMEDNEE